MRSDHRRTRSFLRWCALRWCALGILIAVAEVRAEPYTPSPIAPSGSLFIEQLTWMQVRDAVRSGKRTVIIPTGGIEQNGPFVQLNKHDLIVRELSSRLARRLGDALIAPVISFVPEGQFDPPSGHLRFPGTIGVREETFEQLLADVATSMKLAGFTRLIFIGDSYDNQRGMAAVAARLDAEWRAAGVRVRHIADFYQPDAIDTWLRVQGYAEQPAQYHESLGFTVQLLAIDPAAARADERAKIGTPEVNGVPLVPLARFIELGRQAFEIRIDRTLRALKELERGDDSLKGAAQAERSGALPK